MVRKHNHFIMYKPDGVLSQFRGEKKKVFLGDIFTFPEGTMAVGRLDEESEGLLLLTTDGFVSETIRSSDFEKEYLVQVDGMITEDACRMLARGVAIRTDRGIYETQPCHVLKHETAPLLPPRTKKIRDDRHGPTSWVSIILKEGKFRQIRKMTAKVGFPTLRIVRIRIGKIQLGELMPGQVIEVPALL